MKHFFFFCFFICLGSSLTEAQTYAGSPDSSHVLVVYKHPANEQDTLGNISKNVMEYYKNARGIPGANVARLDDLTEESYSCAELENFT